MTPLVSIIMGSTSDLPVMEKAAKVFDQLEIPFRRRFARRKVSTQSCNFSFPPNISPL